MPIIQAFRAIVVRKDVLYAAHMVYNLRFLILIALFSASIPYNAVRAAAEDAVLTSVQERLSDPVAIEKFYETRSGEPLWLNDAKLNADGKLLLSTLTNAWQHGLNPAQYNIKKIEELLSIDVANLTENEIFSLELLLTDGMVRYARDLGGVRIKASNLGNEAAAWKKRPNVQTVLESFYKNKVNFKDYLDNLAPRTQTYLALKDELVRLVEKTKDEDDPPQLVFKGLVMPGRGYADIPKLRERLQVEGDVPQNDIYKYDEDLVFAVKKFQTDRGLKADGIIGERTLHALNITRRDKIKQLIVNLERLRWVPDQKPKRFIVVNIPSAMLWAIEDGKIIHEMPVIVGRAQRPTPSLITEIHGVRFNPTWTVPETIKEEDMLPKLREDPGYFIDKGMELYDRKGPEAKTIDPTTVDWAKVTETQVKKMHMVQIPGAHNPLGSIRVLMPNPQNIYLHDTNHHSLFDKYDRAQSSGCIRMKDPQKIADFILSYKKNWKPEKIEELLKAGKTKDLYVDEKMPVFLLYYSAWVDENGGIVYGMDLYENDKNLLQALEKLDGFTI